MGGDNRIEFLRNLGVSNRTRIETLCHTYVRLVAAGIGGDYLRTSVHKELLRCTRIREDLLKDILHHLEDYISFDVRIKERRYLVLMGKKLTQLIFEIVMREVKDFLESDGGVMEFFRYKAIDVNEWIERWSEEMEFDQQHGFPLLRNEKETLKDEI